MIDYSDPMNTDPPPFPEFEKVASAQGVTDSAPDLYAWKFVKTDGSWSPWIVLHTAADVEAFKDLMGHNLERGTHKLQAFYARSPAGCDPERALARAGETISKLDRRVIEQDREIITLRDLVESASRIEARLADAYAALRCIAEGNLGDASWQANYATLKQVARNALPEDQRNNLSHPSTVCAGDAK